VEHSLGGLAQAAERRSGFFRDDGDQVGRAVAHAYEAEQGSRYGHFMDRAVGFEDADAGLEPDARQLVQIAVHGAPSGQLSLKTDGQSGSAAFDASALNSQ
jgi:hypothetical protein